MWSQAQNPELINDILDINIAGIRDILSPLFLWQTLYSFFETPALSRAASISPTRDPPSGSVLPTVSPFATIFGPCHLLFLQLSFSFSPLRTGLVIQFERCEKDLSSCTLLHFYPRLHGSISEFLSPVLLMRCRYPGASATPNPVTEKGRRWISSAAPLTYPRSTQVYLCLPVSHFAPYCRIMSLQDGILRLSESRRVDASCLILWPYAGGKTEGQRMWRAKQPVGLMLTFLKLAGLAVQPDLVLCLCETGAQTCL